MVVSPQDFVYVWTSSSDISEVARRLSFISKIPVSETSVAKTAFRLIGLGVNLKRMPAQSRRPPYTAASNN